MAPQVADLATGISLCNDGAQLLDQGMYGESIQRLTAAMKVCRQCCATQATPSHLCQKEDDTPVRFDLDVLFKPRKDATHNTRTPRRAALDGFVFQYPLRLPPLLSTCDSSIHLIMAVICFNLGIAYHVLAFKCDKSKSAATLKKALQLYKTAERMQRHSSKSSKALFRSALLNNIAHVFKSLQEADLSRTYYNRLLSLIIYMVSFKNTDAVHYEQYLSFLLRSKRICASAA